MVCDFDQIKSIIKNPTSKALIEKASKYSEKLRLHVHGQGLDKALTRFDYFENPDVFKERTRYVVSNKDLFARLLQSEDMVFTAIGGYTGYEGLQEKETQEFTAYLDVVRYGMKLRKWISMFGIDAYRCDPMSVIFIELTKEGKPYPTYKCISSIYDYQYIGRKIEYICFQLTIGEVKELGIKDETLGTEQNKKCGYFRFVDDAKDYIFKNTEGEVVEVAKTDTFQGTLANQFQQTPAILVSDIPCTYDSAMWLSPLDKCIELADRYLEDRSVRDLTKKYHGYPKAWEPQLTCERCGGSGFLAGAACPECTPLGADKGLGFKLRTKPADIARFPIDADMPNPSTLYGYAEIPIDVWNKQDSSLNDLENSIKDVYWGTEARNTRSQPSGQMESIEETATKTLENLQPKYARLNKTADWAQSTENKIVDFIGKILYPSTFKQSNITYGRYYILESPEELSDDYLNKKKSGAPESELTDTLKRYYHSLYKDNVIKLNIALKMMNVEPFIHLTSTEVMNLGISGNEYKKKLYFTEWFGTLNESKILVTPEDKLKAELLDYATKKDVELISIPKNNANV